MPPVRSEAKASKGKRASPAKIYVCSHRGCSYSSDRSSDVKRHELTHKTPEERAQRSHPCPDPSCDKSFLQLSNLKNHMRKHGDGCIVCDIPGCDFKTKDDAALSRHKIKHPEVHRAKRKPKNYGTETQVTDGSTSSQGPAPVSSSSATPPRRTRASKRASSSLEEETRPAAAGVSTPVHPAQLYNEQYSSPSVGSSAGLFLSPFSRDTVGCSSASSYAVQSSPSHLSDFHAQVTFDGQWGFEYTQNGFDATATQWNHFNPNTGNSGFAPGLDNPNLSASELLNAYMLSNQTFEEQPDALYQGAQNNALDACLPIPEELTRDFSWTEPVVDESGNRYPAPSYIDPTLWAGFY